MLFEGGLIIFYGKEIIGVLFVDDEVSGVFLRVQGIEGNDTALNIERFKELSGNGDFVGRACNFALGNNDTFLVEKCRKQMHRGAVFLSCALEGFSINCDSKSFSCKRTEPVGECLINGIGVNAL